MKKIIFACLLVVLSISLSLAQTTGNQTDANGKKQGSWEEKSPTGTTKGVFIDDKKDGCWSSYTADGKLTRIEHFNKGNLQGIAVEIDQRGYLVSESYFEKNLLEGTAKKFYYGTSPASIIDYSKGKINGKKKIYYENSSGKIQEESDYKNDIKDGVSNYYSINGDPIVEYIYKNNLIQGVVKSYYPGKKLMSEQEYKDNIENGFYKEYYETAKPKIEGNYTNGSMSGIWKNYDEEGRIAGEGSYLNGEKEGKWLEYDATGKVVKTVKYSKGQIIK